MNTAVSQKFTTYPKEAVEVLSIVRKHIYLSAKEHGLDLTESLKWGEPSYVCQGGSAVRFDWKSKHPDQIAVYFNCQTKLVETFKEIYADVFRFEGNRAMVFGLNDDVDWMAFRHCVGMSLRYHKIKNLPLLGA